MALLLAVPLSSAQSAKEISKQPVADFTSKISVREPELGKLEFSDVAAVESLRMDFLGKDAADNEIPIGDILDFKTIVDSSNPERYKWSYEFILPDEKFVPEIWVTGDSAEILDGRYVFLNKKYLVSFDDVLEYGFKYELRVSDGRSVLVILTKDWVSNGIKVGDKVFIDPTITQYPHDGYIGLQRTGTYIVDISNTPMYVGNDVGSGDSDWIYKIYMRFNTTIIDPWDTVINATFWARVSAKACASGSSRFWLRNMTDYGTLGFEDWNTTYQNISIFFYANENTTGWYSVNVTDWIAKGGMTAYRIAGTYEDYDGVDCFISINSNESIYEPYLEVWWTDITPNPPNVTIVSPLNMSYNTSVLNLSVIPVGGVGSVDTWWYSLNGGANTTFIPNATILANLGGNCIRVWLNSTYGSVSTNQTCFTVLTYGANLDCYAIPSSLPSNSTLHTFCNYSYARNSTAVSNGNCSAKLNQSITIRRFYNVTGESSLYGNEFSGFGVYLPTSITVVGGGTYLRCTNSTSGNLTVYDFISANLPFTSLNGTQNISLVNYTNFYGSFSCDYLDSLFGVKGNMSVIALLANMSWVSERLALLGNPPYAYYGFYAGCPACAGGSDTWYVGIDIHNSGYTYAGNLSQTDNWGVKAYEHAQWLYSDVPALPMAYNATSGLYHMDYFLGEWTSIGTMKAYGNCTAPSVQSRVSDFSFNTTGSTLPSCSITGYINPLSFGYNQTFVLTRQSVTPFIGSLVEVRNGTGDMVFNSTLEGAFSFLPEVLGTYHIICVASNIVGQYNTSVAFDVMETSYTLQIYSDPFAEVGVPTYIYGVILQNGVSVNPIANLTFDIDVISGNMLWNSTTHVYEIGWIPSSVGIYLFNVSGNLPPFMVDFGNITVVDDFICIDVSLWTNVTMSPESRYKNEWAHVYVVRDVDAHFAGLWGRDTFQCAPQGVPECYWHGEYINGTAHLCLPSVGNYTLYMIGNNILWQSVIGDLAFECANCAPTVVKQTMNLPLGEYFFDAPESLDLYYNPAEMATTGGLLGWLTAPLGLIALAAVAIIFFFIVLIFTGSLTAALAALVLLPTIIMIFIGVIMGGL